MRILALIKYSLDTAEIKVDPATKELKMADVPFKLGNIDKNVAEAAVQVKEAAGGSLIGLTLGTAEAKDVFKDVLAMGVDEMYLVEEAAAGDTEAALSILEAAIRKLGDFDLIFCGFASDDGYSYQTGPRLAERLGLPLVSYVSSISVQDGKVKADRNLEQNIQTVAAPLPAIVSVAEEAFPPRRTTLMDALKAKKKPVTTWTVADVAAAPVESKLQSVSQLGIVVHRKQVLLKGKPVAELADALIDALLQENVLKGGA